MKTFKQHTNQILSIMILPITLWLIIFNIYTVYEVSKGNRSQNYEDRLSLIVHRIESDLAQTEAFMIPFINNTDFKILGYHTSQDRLFDASQQVISLYDPLKTVNSNISGILIYSSPNDYYRINVDNYVNSNVFVKYLKQTLTKTDAYHSKWYIDMIGGSQYFIRIMHVKGAYQMCFINTDKFLKSCLGSISEEEAITVITDHYTLKQQVDDIFQEKALNRLKEKNSAFLNVSGVSYIFTKAYSQYLNLDFVYAAPYHFIISITQIILILVSIMLMVILIPLGTLKFRKTCLLPLDALTDTMNHIKGGNMNERCSVDSNIDEYQQLGNAFNEMLEQIENLKIDSYEKTLEAQKTELQYRHMQIRPHFFLNCLKTLYGLAECRDYVRLQELILAFSVYFRGIFGSSQMLSIQEELILVNNYITLQTSTSIMKLSYKEKMDPRTKDYMIPSLMILTFVENSIKHGRSFDIPLTICVSVNLIEGDGMNYLNISISDNGPGFQNDELYKLNSGCDLEYADGTHIGISNIKKRCHLIYGEEATITFMHSNGAMIELFLPIKEKQV